MLILAFGPKTKTDTPTMPKTCAYEGCNNNCWGGGYCPYHQWVRKAPTTIPPVSEKKQDNDVVYYAARKTFLAHPENKYCKIKAPGCTRYATVIHHVLGRVLHYLTVWTWRASCRHCNNYVEDNHQWAVDRGHKGSKFANVMPQIKEI